MKNTTFRKAILTSVAVTGLAGAAWAAKAPHVEDIIKPISAPIRNVAEEYLMLAGLLCFNSIGAFALYKAFTGAKDPVV
jgi:hypothetical protein